MDIYNRLGKLSLLDVICDRLVNIERKIEGTEMEVKALKSKVINMMIVLDPWKVVTVI